MTHETDTTLIDMLKAGNMQALLSLYKKYKQGLYQFSLQLVRNTDEAEDIVEETFVKLIDHVSTLTQPAKLKSWLFSVARNEALMMLKRRGKRMEITEETIFETDGIDMLINNSERHALIKRKIEQLKFDYKEIVLLREYEQLSYEEIASITGNSLAAVKSRLFKARKELSKHLLPYVNKEAI